MKPAAKVFFIAIVAMAGNARADIFKCVDSAGHVTYTNTRTSERGCSLLARDQPFSSVPPLIRKAPTVRSPGESASDFPRVEAATQKARDTDRRRILEQELASEEKALRDAQRQLADQEAASARNGRNNQVASGEIKPLQDKVHLHERNIDSLRREMGNLK